nr:MAG TPA: hypothetical protein [Caudoviricetes sp.]
MALALLSPYRLVVLVFLAFFTEFLLMFFSCSVIIP